MKTYDQRAKKELEKWKKQIYTSSSPLNKTTKDIQNKINGLLPEKYHRIMTEAVRKITKAVILGAEYTTRTPYKNLMLIERDDYAKEKTEAFKKVAMIEGISTGAGGIWLGLADFPLLLSIKIKFLYELAAVYGFNTDDYRERLFILYVFQLAFSSESKAKEVLAKLEKWESYAKTLPYDNKDFDWRSFQQEYRDYLDFSKLLQLLPGIGAIVGAYVNTRLIKKLSTTAIQAYHMRLL